LHTASPSSRLSFAIRLWLELTVTAPSEKPIWWSAAYLSLGEVEPAAEAQQWKERPMIRLPKWLIALLSIAILLGLTSAVLALEAKGKIKSVSADKKEMTITNNDGKDFKFVMDDDAKIQLNDKDSKLSELKKGDEVTVTYEKKDGKLIASKVECKRD
jgi:Cu/Ag efflux protein CusF